MLCRSLSKSNSYTETFVETSTGRVLVAHTQQEITNSRPVIVTYHDLGLNYVSNFQAFFNYPDFKVNFRRFWMIALKWYGWDAMTLVADI